MRADRLRVSGEASREVLHFSVGQGGNMTNQLMIDAALTLVALYTLVVVLPTFVWAAAREKPYVR